MFSAFLVADKVGYNKRRFCDQSANIALEKITRQLL